MRCRVSMAALVVAASVGVRAQDVGPISHEGVVESSVEQVWAAFTTSEGLRSWLAPHAEIDLKVGGLMRTNYNPQGQLGDAGTIENVILSFEPQRMMSIKVAKPPANFPFPNAVHKMWTVLYFSPASPGRTNVREVTLGFGPDPESQRMRAFFNHGNASTLSQLQRRFAAKSVLVPADENLGTYEDRIAVEDVMARYVWAVDSLDADGYVAVFTKDAVIDSNGNISKGHDEIRKIVTSLIQRRDDNKAKGLPPSNLYHVISKVRITFPKANEAVHHSYWQTVRRDKDGRMIAAAMGRPEDHLVKRNGKWLIQFRKLTVFTD